MSAIDSMLLQYKKVSEAPTLDDLKKSAERLGVDLSAQIEKEAQTEYKAISDPLTANVAVWLVQNPALLTYQFERGAKTLTRKSPKCIARGQKAIDALAKKRTNSKIDGKNQNETYSQKD